jgi:tetratricopeptide (TPR) repeat protein
MQYKPLTVQVPKMLLLLFMPLMITVCSAKTTPHKPSPASTDVFVNQRLKNFYSWLNAPWTDEDAPYQAIRERIDTVLDKSSQPTMIVNSYQAESKKSPTDPKALFAYCYSAFKATELPNGISDTQFDSKFDALYTPIANAALHLPHTYNYARLVFLGDSRYNSAAPDLIPIGKRLFEHSPKDADVEYAFARMLVFSKNPTDINLAISHQQNLARRFPNDPRTDKLLGIIYYRKAWLSHSQTEADKSIAAYRRAYELSPQDKATQHFGEITIKFIQDLKAQWKVAGTG